MKIKSILFTITTLILLTSCGVFMNKAKLKLSEAAGEGVAKLVSSEVNKALVCDGEAVKLETDSLKDSVTDAMEKLLKVKAPTVTVSAMSNSGLITSVATIACKGALGTALPLLVSAKFSEYPCIVKVFGVRMEGVADKVCAKIKL